MLLCAVLLVQVEGVNHTTIVPCRRHGDGLSMLKDLGYAPKTKYTVISQGFITHTGEFLDRKEAYVYACKCNQLSQTTIWYKEDRADTELYSEDLY